MAKKRKRIYEHAKELGISSTELMHKLKFMGIRVENTFNAVDDTVIHQIKQQMGMHLFEDPADMPPPPPSPPPVEVKKEEKPAAAVAPPVAPSPVQPKQEHKPAAPPQSQKPQGTTAATTPPPRREGAPSTTTTPQRPDRRPADRPQGKTFRPGDAPRDRDRRPSSSPQGGGARPSGGYQGTGGAPRPSGGYQGGGAKPSGGYQGTGGAPRPSGGYQGGGGRPSGGYQGTGGAPRPSGGYQGTGGAPRPSGGYQGTGGAPRPSGGYQGTGGAPRPSGGYQGGGGRPSGGYQGGGGGGARPGGGYQGGAPKKPNVDDKPVFLEKDKPRRSRDKSKDVDKKKDQNTDFASPSKRLEAIKKRGLQERVGTKTTFLKKKTKRDKNDPAFQVDQTEVKKKITISGPMTVKELSHEMGLKSSDVIMYLMKDLSLMTTLNQSLDKDVITLVAESFDCTVEIVETEETDEVLDELLEKIEPDVDETTVMIHRPPVVTVMGHVDHGKTRLLDTIRHTNIIDTESGGITQHIGAYQVEHNGRKITFLDTPGHEAFTKLRARGAKITDLAVLVVAADDGVMPQTLEAIDHAREANVPIIVAVNKMDKSDAKPDRVRQQLAEKDLVPEEWGGKTVYVNISAKFNTNIEDLLEMIFLVTEMAELKAAPKRKALGTVIEGRLDKGKGPVVDVLIQNGTLHISDYIVVGETYGKVRAMENDRGDRIVEAGPSTPVEIIGLNAVPEAGDRLMVLEDEKTAKEIAMKRLTKNREEKLRFDSRITLETLITRIQEEKLKEFKIVLKADVQGSIEAISQALEGIKHDEVRIKVIRAGVGDIKETDIMLAAASNAVVMGYRVGILPTIEQMSEREKVEVVFYDIIYNLTDSVRRAMAGLLSPEFEKEYTGKMEIRTLFSSSKVGTIAGAYVTDGEVFANNVAVLKREGQKIFEGKIKSLRRFKDSAKSVKSGFECGILLEGFNDFKEGDIVETHKMVEKKREMI